MHSRPLVPRQTWRFTGVINVPYAMVDTVRRSLFVRAVIRVNGILFACEDLDMFHDSPLEFRAKVLAYVKKL